MAPWSPRLPERLIHRPSELPVSLLPHPLPTAEGSNSQPNEPSSAIAPSFLAWNPSVDPPVDSESRSLCNLGLLIHPYVLGKPNHYSSLSPGVMLLIPKKLLPGMRCPFPNDPLLRIQIRCHLLPKVHLLSATSDISFRATTTPLSL